MPIIPRVFRAVNITRETDALDDRCLEEHQQLELRHTIDRILTKKERASGTEKVSWKIDGGGNRG